jgi:phosphatidylinositol alpha-1,6-mannosyltransferase
MRILMLDNEFPPLGGGMGTANLELFKHFARLPELKIDLITSAMGGKSEFEQFSQNISIYKVPVWNKNIHHSSNRELILYAVQALVKAWRLARDCPYDFCFAWSALPAGAVALALDYSQGLPYMVWVSGPDIPGFERRYRYLYPPLAPLLRRVWRHASPLIAKCQEEVDMIHAVDARVKVEIIPNGADLADFTPKAILSQNRHLSVICVARLIERKGQKHLIESVKRLADEGVEVEAKLAGTGDSLHEYRALAKKLGIERRIRFLGYVPREDLRKFYQDADVFVLPSSNEGMSLAALEAMAAGLPLVVTRTGGTSMLVEEGINGFTFDWADIDSLVNYLRKFAANRDLIPKMGIGSRIVIWIYLPYLPHKLRLAPVSRWYSSDEDCLFHRSFATGRNPICIKAAGRGAGRP